MTIEIKKDGYYVGFWFVGDGRNHDWLGILSRDGDHFRFEYRFRYYTGDQTKDAFEAGDKKSFWTATLPSHETEASAIVLVDGLVMDLVNQGFGTNPVKTLIQGDGLAFAKAFQKAPFAHVATVDGLSAKPTGQGGAA